MAMVRALILEKQERWMLGPPKPISAPAPKPRDPLKMTASEWLSERGLAGDAYPLWRLTLIRA